MQCCYSAICFAELGFGWNTAKHTAFQCMSGGKSNPTLLALFTTSHQRWKGMTPHYLSWYKDKGTYEKKKLLIKTAVSKQRKQEKSSFFSVEYIDNQWHSLLQDIRCGFGNRWTRSGKKVVLKAAKHSQPASSSQRRRTAKEMLPYHCSTLKPFPGHC